jgi:hypothetical protein
MLSALSISPVSRVKAALSATPEPQASPGDCSKLPGGTDAGVSVFESLSFRLRVCRISRLLQVSHFPTQSHTACYQNPELKESVNFVRKLQA